ncbi:NACalpha-BTF3-like transcription factor [Pseudomonas nitritireducens]|uniref:NACalpha-BTF3-like transcription factor n=1 Tax=Pseudomonas nitroreducens TaxID=46680 RepID=A0A7W7KQA6_PSENT|nr:hypothetical protein [Pseudomonas nitritireducens]MBB4866906.1 NACalpha-BTF3-like transcription factor [Pseudomonas nitritireducens]
MPLNISENNIQILARITDASPQRCRELLEMAQGDAFGVINIACRRPGSESHTLVRDACATLKKYFQDVHGELEKKPAFMARAGDVGPVPETAEITAESVRILRQISGHGMMECRKALVAANGNVLEAVGHLFYAGCLINVKNGGYDAWLDRMVKSFAEAHEIRDGKIVEKKGVPPLKPSFMIKPSDYEQS